MSGVTDNYGLILPAAGEPYNVEVVNANNITIDARIKDREKEAKGIVAYSEMANNSVAFSGTLVATFIANFTFKANRRYRVGTSGGGTLSDTTSTFAGQIVTCSTADANSDVTPANLTQIKGRNFRTDAAGEGREFLLMSKENLVFGADTSKQIKLTVGRLNGAGTITLFSDDTNRVCLFIEDLGVQF